jgi:alkylation response protein AidB-like acyl-CoA dehydrogenase
MAYNFAYKNNRDIKFILKEWLPLENVLAYPRFRENYGLDDLDPIFDTIMKICKEVIEPSADDGEKNPVRFDNGKVILPPTIAPLYKKLQEEGWGTSNIDKSEGAMTLPASILYPVWELFAAANPAFVPPFLAMPAGSAELIQSFGDEHVKKMFLPKMLDGTWAGTMCLTEPSAGSDVETYCRALILPNIPYL